MVSQRAVEEYYQLRETLRPFLEERMGLDSQCRVQDAVEAIEQLVDFEDHLVTNDPDMLDNCAEMMLVAKTLLQKYISQNGGRRYLASEDQKKLEQTLNLSD